MGMKPALIIVGLGNPGKSYEHTRHNTGFRAVDALAGVFGVGEWGYKQKFHADICEGRIVTIPVLLVKPRTFMNLSGESVRKIMDFYHMEHGAVLVIGDDIDLPLGEARYREKGGAGTHNGMKSVVDTIGEHFPRIRIGLGEAPKNVDLSAWVLSQCTLEEEQKLEEAFKKIPDMLKEYVGL